MSTLMFKLVSSFSPTGDQPQAIEKLYCGLKAGVKHQVLLGVTGSGKTFTMANLIEKYQRPTLIISHNKTLAAQLYQEFKEFFPDNAVSYFVSYYDYYQPEAYLPKTDTYIEKETEINDEIDKLRLAATTNLLTRPDTIVIASVSCIYNLGSPVEYGRSILELAPGLKITRDQILMRLTDIQYVRSDFDFHRGTYRIRGDFIDIYPAYEDVCIRVHHQLDKITKLEKLDPLTGTSITPPPQPTWPTTNPGSYKSLTIYPAKHYLTSKDRQTAILDQIRRDLDQQIEFFQLSGQPLFAHRLRQRVNYDLEMINELGYVNGIENYSRYFDGRQPGDPPFSLLDYFPPDYLLIIDESHITLPQIRGMYQSDKSRKQALVDYGFRLPSALDNRPLRFDEFCRRQGQTIYVSATPGEYELSLAGHHIAEQLIRPTGLVDPEISVRPTTGQIADLISEILTRVAKKQRVLVTTLTKRMAEDLTQYLSEQNLKVQYLHADVKTLQRVDILSDLRSGAYDVVVGINLLREGLDLPEVSLVAILDADKEGFLRSRVSLIQTMGRAARHLEGSVIMYADQVTPSMRAAIDEVARRRQIQLKYNQDHHITPQSISKAIRERIVDQAGDPPLKLDPKLILRGRGLDAADVDLDKVNQLTPQDKTKLLKLMRQQMLKSARQLDFETAAQIRDRIRQIEQI